MDITPNPKSRWLKPSYKVRFDSQQEVQDVASYGHLSEAKTRTLFSTAVVYPVAVDFSQSEVRAIGVELAAASDRPEVWDNAELYQRLVALGGTFLTAVETS